VGSHAQTTISNSSTIFFQPNFAGLLKLPLEEKERERQEFEMKDYIYYKLVDVRCPVVGDRTFPSTAGLS